MKKFLSLLLAVLMLFMLAACGDEGGQKQHKTEKMTPPSMLRM